MVNKDADYILEFSDVSYSNYISNIQEGCDPVNTYSVNSIGMRSPEINELADLVTLGCSQTFGMGVPDKSIWPEILANKLNMTYANIACNGYSVQGIYNSLVAYVREFGKPKVVAALLPGYHRIALGLRYDTVDFYYEGKQPSNIDSKSRAGIFHGNLEIRGSNTKSLPKYSKRPHNLMDILPYEMAYYNSMIAVVHLVEYCKVAGIPLVFSSWHSKMQEKLVEKYNQTVSVCSIEDLKLIGDGTEIRKSCHKNSITDSNKASWTLGTDCGHHIGSHMHIHYAEAFYDKYISMTK
jgi:hypothetical protein